MDKHIDWFKKLDDDLIEQFKGKPNMQVFNRAVARQLEEVYAFFYELSVLRWLDEAEGVQLDGIGNIVDLSRTDALIWSSAAGLNVPMDDDLYRLYLRFKIFLNTSEATYKDIVRTLEMFWPHSPIYYSEFPEHPATMFFTTSELPVDTDLRVLGIVKRVKAGGVAVRFVIPVREERETGGFQATAVSTFEERYTVSDMPDIPADITDYTAGVAQIYKEEDTRNENNRT